jgi:hypothetical protein
MVFFIDGRLAFWVFCIKGKLAFSVPAQWSDGFPAESGASPKAQCNTAQRDGTFDATPGSSGATGTVPAD